MLKLAGETALGLEKIESIYHTSPTQDSGDLETGTHTIVPTTRPAIGSAQYSKSLIVPGSPDPRLVVKRIAVKLNINIVGLGTATHVYLSVRVDVDDADHELFSEDWTSAGSKLDAVDTHAGGKATIFNLLKDAGAHTFYFLFWADVADQATIDIVHLWEGIGTCATSPVEIVKVAHEGFFSTFGWITRTGTGTNVLFVGASPSPARAIYSISGITEYGLPSGLLPEISYRMYGSVATDINTIEVTNVILRSEQ